ncbi:MAG: hypothetical protein CR974_00960 [Gammaproteobacteria bacterium]|nr:MAG: hypothetical protein CR974_00960 [Gammaproteobacteria bacterium]
MPYFFLSLRQVFAGTGVLFFSLFLLLLGGGLQGSLVSIRGTDEGFSTLVLSIISTGYYVGYFSGAIIVPMWLKRVGYIRVFAALVAMASVAAIIYPMFIDKNLWFAMRVLTGFCFAGIFMVCESWLNSQTYNENRGKVLSMYLIIIFVGMTTGQFLLNIGDINGYFLFALGSIVISVASVPLLLTTRPAPVIDESTVTLTIRQLYRRSPLGVVSSFFANFMNGTIIGLAAIYAKSIGLPIEQIAWFVASAYIGVIIFQLPIGYLSDRIDRRYMMIFLCLSAAAISLWATNLHDSQWLILSVGLLGGVALPMYAICIAHVNDRLKPEEVLPATTALLKIAGVGNMVAPLFTGWLMVQWGVEWFFGAVGVAAAIVALFAMYRTTQADLDIDEQSDYAPIGAMTATSATLSLAHEGIQLEFDFGEAHRKPADAEYMTIDSEDEML